MGTEADKFLLVAILFCAILFFLKGVRLFLKTVFFLLAVIGLLAGFFIWKTVQ